MSVIAASKLKAVRILIATAPDSAVRSLRMAMAGAGGDLSQVRDMVEAEVAEREFAATVFAPVCGRGQGLLHRPVRFEAPQRRKLIELVRESEPALVSDAARALSEMRAGDPAPAELDAICLAAAAALRERPEEAAGLDPDAAPCLDMAPLVRSALERAPVWLGRAHPEHAAALRLMMRDAAQLAEDGVPRFLNLLSTHLEDAGQILRFISAALGRPNDNYLAESELAVFGEAALAAVDARIEMLKGFTSDQGPEAARRAGLEVNAACALMFELEACFELGRDGPWGLRVAAQKRAVAAAVEARLRDVGDAVGRALPMQTVRVVGRMTRSAPKLDERPPEQATRRAYTLATFLDAVRASGAEGGFGALRAKTAALVVERVSAFADETIAAMNAFEAPDEALALELLETAAQFLVLADDAKAAAVVRRRAQHAGASGVSQQSA